MNTNEFTKKTLIVAGITICAVAVAAFFVYGINVILLVFAGLLLSLFLRGLGKFLQNYIPVSNSISIILVIVLLLIFATGTGFLLGPSITEGFTRLGEKIPDAIEELKSTLKANPLGQDIINKINGGVQDFFSNSEIASKITGIFSTTFGTIVNFFVIIVVGLYTAFDPDLYIRGFIRLFPVNKRDRVKEIFQSVSHALGWWMVGQFASMFVVGVLTSIGLWILGIPLAVTLGILAAVLTFIPNIGPFLSAIPAVLIGLIQGPAEALYVIFLYIGIQTFESYLITPLIQKRTVSMPPALLISTQILMGVLLGAFGLLLATPLLVAVIVLIQMIYINDILGDSVKILGE